MRAFVEKRRDAHRVEPICRVPQIAPSGYRRHATWPHALALRSQRTQRDQVLTLHIEPLWRANFLVFGAKVGQAEDPPRKPCSDRCVVERLIRR